MPRRLPRFHTLFALLGCLLYAWCALAQARVGALAAGRPPAGLPRARRRVGRPSAAEARFAAGAVRPGQTR